jgi:hypothetical protein
MDRKVKCRFCKQDVFLSEFRTHLRDVHPTLLKEKIQEAERVDSMNDMTLLSMFTMMELLHEVPPVGGGEVIQEHFEGKGGEFGGAGASEDIGECDTDCKSCDLHESEPESDSPSDESSSGDSDNNE